MKHVALDALYDAFAPKLTRRDVAELQKWLRLQPHLPELRELHLIAALVSCNYSMEKAKRTIDAFITLRGRSPEMFLNRDPNAELVKQCLSTMLFCAMPRTTPEGHMIAFVKILDANPDKYDCNTCVKIAAMAISVYLEENGPILGYHAIVDCTGVSMKHVVKTNIVTVRKGLQFLQEAFPVPLQSIHVVNAVPWIDRIVDVGRPYIKANRLKLLHIHPEGDNESIFKYFSKDLLPNELGGTCGNAMELRNEVVASMYDPEAIELYKIEDAIIADESRRPAKAYFKPDNLFGVEGTFKRIELD